jgi:hypothetical protein
MLREVNKIKKEREAKASRFFGAKPDHLPGINYRTGYWRKMKK